MPKVLHPTHVNTRKTAVLCLSAPQVVAIYPSQIVKLACCERYLFNPSKIKSSLFLLQLFDVHHPLFPSSFLTSLLLVC